MRFASRGFTLVELLVVKADIASMKGDPRNLAVAQEAYFFDNSTYYDGPVPSAEERRSLFFSVRRRIPILSAQLISRV